MGYKLKLLLIIFFCFTQKLNAETCQLQAPSGEGYLQKLNQGLSSTRRVSVECFEQEFIEPILDPLLNPYRLQSLALKLCEEKTECKNFLYSEASRVSLKSEKDFKNLPLVFVWSEILKYSGFNRIRPPTIQDLPLDNDPEVLLNKIQNEKIDARLLNQSNSLKISCAALALILGPAKLKALKVAAIGAKTYKIQNSSEVAKLLSKNKLPTIVKEKFLKWSQEVETKGLDEVRKIPGYHDEPLRSNSLRRSVRMNDGYRACYEVMIENGVSILKIITISNDHKSYCI